MNPTLTELIESAIRSVGRVEAILDRMEARERVMEAAAADIQWAPADPAPGHPELPLASTPHVQVQDLPTVTGEGPAVDLAMPRKNPNGPDRFAAPVAVPAHATDKPRLIPEVGNYYWLRNGKTARILAREGKSFKGEIHGSDGDTWLPFYWHADGTPFDSIGTSEWDIVELCPF